MKISLVRRQDSPGYVTFSPESAAGLDATMEIRQFGTVETPRSLARLPLEVGYTVANDVVFFGDYAGNGVANIGGPDQLQRYDGKHFMFSKRGFFTRDMMFCAKGIPNILTPGSDETEFVLTGAAIPERTISEEVVFLGVYHSHFGHALVESLVRLWFIDKMSAAQKQATKFVFFGGWGELKPSDPLAQILSWLGVPFENLYLCREDVVFSNMIIPGFAWRPWNKLFLSPVMYDTLRKICQSAGVSAPSKPGRKIYLTRSQLDRTKKWHNNRSLDEPAQIAVEEHMQRLGFEIVAPETMSFGEQISLVSEASTIAGPAGSAQHLAAFAYALKEQVILTHPRFQMLGPDAVFAWDKSAALDYYLGERTSPAEIPDLVSDWTLNVPEFLKFASDRFS